MHRPCAAHGTAATSGAEVCTFAPGGGRFLVHPCPFHSQAAEVFMARQNVADPHESIWTAAGVGLGPSSGRLHLEPFQMTVVRVIELFFR